MDVYSNILLLSSGFTLAVSLFFLLLEKKESENKLYRYFVCAAMPIALYTILLHHLYAYGPKNQYYHIIRSVQLVCLTINFIFFPLLIARVSRIELPHHFRIAVVLMVLFTGIRMMFPVEAQFHPRLLPWDEVIYLFKEPLTPIKLAQNLLAIVTVIYITAVLVRGYLRKENTSILFIFYPLTFFAILVVDIILSITNSNVPQTSPLLLAAVFGGIAVTIGNSMIDGLQKKEELFRKNQELNKLTDNDEIAVYTKNTQGEYVIPGRYICTLLTAEKSQIVGKRCEDFFRNGEGTDIAENDAAVMSSKTAAQFEETIILKGRKLTYVSYKSPIINESGTVTGIIGISIDRTQRRIMEQKISQVQKFTSLGELAGEIAHNFNNTLTRIMGMAEVMKETAAYDEECVQSIITTSRDSAQYIRQILEFSKQSTTANACVDIKALTEKVLSLYEKTAGAQISMVRHIDSGPFCVLGHETNLQSALSNIFVNSLDAITEKGRIEIALQKTYIDQNQSINYAVKKGNYIRITIEDTGSGIPRNIQEKIFTPFFTTKGRDKGTGLGLASVFKTVKTHHGGILLSSEEGCGTTFEILLPEYQPQKNS
ncbi:MAG: ATP-binding protein [Fibrobacterota bacterium]